MKSFTATEFRADSSKVYNEVMIKGQVVIIHRDRPDMVIMTEAKLNEKIGGAIKNDRLEGMMKP